MRLGPRAALPILALPSRTTGGNGPRYWYKQPTPCFAGWSWRYRWGDLPNNAPGDWGVCVKMTPKAHPWGPEPCDELYPGATLATFPDPDVQEPLGAWIEDIPKVWTGLNTLQSTRGNWTWTVPPPGAPNPPIPWAPTRPRPDPSGRANCAYIGGSESAGPDRCGYPSVRWPLGQPYLCEADCRNAFAYACTWTPPPTVPPTPCPTDWLYDAGRARCVGILASSPGAWTLGEGVCNSTAAGATLISLDAQAAAWLKLKLQGRAEVWVGLSRPKQDKLEWRWVDPAAPPPPPFADAWASNFPAGVGGCAYAAGIRAQPPPPPSPPLPPPPLPPPPPCPPPNSTFAPTLANPPTGAPSNATAPPSVAPSRDPGPDCPENSGQLCDGDCDAEFPLLCEYTPANLPAPPVELPMAPAEVQTMTKSLRIRTRTHTLTRSIPPTPTSTPRNRTATPTATRPVSPTATRSRRSPTATRSDPIPEEEEDGSSAGPVIAVLLSLCAVAAAVLCFLRRRGQRSYAGEHIDIADGGAPPPPKLLPREMAPVAAAPPAAGPAPFARALPPQRARPFPEAESDRSDPSSGLGSAESGEEGEMGSAAPYTPVRDAPPAAAALRPQGTRAFIAPPPAPADPPLPAYLQQRAERLAANLGVPPAAAAAALRETGGHAGRAERLVLRAAAPAPAARPDHDDSDLDDRREV